MNGSTPIFPLDILGKAAPSPTGSTADGEDAFAETLAAALAGSTSAAVVPAASQAEASSPSAVDGMSIVGRRESPGAVPIAPAEGCVDPRNDTLPPTGELQASAGQRPTNIGMPSGWSEPTSGLLPKGAVPPMEGRIAMPDIGGDPKASAIIVASDRAGIDARRPSSQISQESATETSLEISTGRMFGSAAYRTSPVHDVGGISGGSHPIDPGQPSTIVLDRDATVRGAGSVVSETARPREHAIEATMHLSHADGVRTESLSTDRLEETPRLSERHPAQPEATISPARASGAAPAIEPSMATTFAADASRPAPLQAAVADPSKPSVDRAVHARDIDVRPDPALLSDGRSMPEATPSPRPLGERQAESSNPKPTSFDIGARLADRLEPVDPAGALPRLARSTETPTAPRGAEGQPVYATASANAVPQGVATDAVSRPNGDALGFERFQAVWSTDGSVNDAPRFEPATPAAPSRAHPPAAGPAPSVQVALQIVRTLPGGVDRLSVHLQPAELGSVDIQLSFDGTGRLSALITAERPETLELLQRDGRLLERSLGDSGLKLSGDGLNFALKQDQQQHQQQHQGQRFQEQAHDRQATFLAGRAYDETSSVEPSPPSHRIDGRRLLDIRT